MKTVLSEKYCIAKRQLRKINTTLLQICFIDNLTPILKLNISVTEKEGPINFGALISKFKGLQICTKYILLSEL